VSILRERLWVYKRDYRKTGDVVLSNEDKIILDLCGGTGAWSRPYLEAGYDVRNITLPDYDVRTYIPPDNVYGILAAIVCTGYCNSGARWHSSRPFDELKMYWNILCSCLAIIDYCWLKKTLKFWSLENPAGRLSRFLGKPAFKFQPSEFGDPYTKETWLWGEFNIPNKTLVLPLEGGKIHKMPPSKDRAMLRSITPPGFARAFFEANQ
jgi:hypothetical protein